jgi:hypothetical protein
VGLSGLRTEKRMSVLAYRELRRIIFGSKIETVI